MDAPAPLSPATAAAEDERARRLTRLQRASSSLVTSVGSLLALGRVSAGRAAPETDAAMTRASVAQISAHVEQLLALIRELRLDLFLAAQSS
jgi:hypothetical protein